MGKTLIFPKLRQELAADQHPLLTDTKQATRHLFKCGFIVELENGNLHLKLRSVKSTRLCQIQVKACSNQDEFLGTDYDRMRMNQKKKEKPKIAETITRNKPEKEKKEGLLEDHTGYSH